MNIKTTKILSEGIAIGLAKKINSNNNSSLLDDIDNELEKFNNTINKSINEIDQLISNHPDMSDYLNVQRLMILDINLKKNVIALLNKGYLIKSAIIEVMNSFIFDLSKTDNEYLKERISDFEDVKNRLINNLSANNSISYNNDKFILLIDELYPSLLISLKNNLLGVIAKKGGYTTHSAIICRGLEIPYVITDADIEDNTNIIIDTNKEIIIANPLNNVIEEYKGISKNNIIIINDNEYKFLANIEDNLELDKVIKYDLDGIGLYRTEMVLIKNNKPLSIEEQIKIYNEALLKLNKPIIFRTFDIGDDKLLSYISTTKKGVNNYWNNLDIFKNQLEAILRSNTNNMLRLMFPMIEDINDYNKLRAIAIDICNKYNMPIPPIGITLETKKALENLTDYKDVDFISIGTNDLALDLYNIKRENIIDYLDNYLEDLLINIKRIVDFCNINNIELSICGEIAGDYNIAKRLFKIGIKNISASLGLINNVKKAYLDFKNE